MSMGTDAQRASADGRHPARQVAANQRLKATVSRAERAWLTNRLELGYAAADAMEGDWQDPR